MTTAAITIPISSTHGVLAGNLLELTGASDPDNDPLAIDTGGSDVRAFVTADGALYIRNTGTQWSYSLTTAAGATFTVPIIDGQGGSTPVTVTLDASGHSDPWMTGFAVATVNGVEVDTVEAGDELRFKVTLINAGSTTLTNVFVRDARFAVRGSNCTPALGPSEGATLLPGEQLTCFSAAYTVLAEDVEYGSITWEIQGYANDNFSSPNYLVAWVETAD